MYKTMTFMNKNTALAKVDIDHTAIRGISEVTNRELFPVMLQGHESDPEIFQAWLNKRLIPKDKREGFAETNMRFVLPEPLHMASLTDQYWFRDTGSWKRINFFTNHYSHVYGDAFFTPWKVEKIMDKDELTPDITSSGVLKKRWKQDPKTKESYLYKVGSEKYKQEPLSEVLASMLLKQIGFKHFVPYELAFEGMQLCSKCKNFIDEHQEFVPMGHFYRREDRNQEESMYDFIQRVCERHGIDGAKNFLDDMIFADFLVCNQDRHLTNFGVIRNVETGKYEGFAPLFDFGTAFVEKRDDKKRPFEREAKRIVEERLTDDLLKSVLPSEKMYRLIRTYPGIEKTEKKIMESKLKDVERFVAEKMPENKEKTVEIDINEDLFDALDLF